MIRKYKIIVISALFIFLGSNIGIKSKDSIPEFLEKNNLKNKIVLIEFGIIGCGLSDQGLNEMIKMHKENSIKSLNYLRLEASEKNETIAGYYKEKNTKIPVIIDPEMKIAKMLGAAVFPRFVLMDKFGQVRYRGSFPDIKDLKKWVETLNKEQKKRNNPALFGVKEVSIKELLLETKLPDLKGKVKSLDSYKGKNGILLVFVDTVCPFSKSFIDTAEDTAKAIGGYKIETVSVNIGESKSRILKTYKDAAYKIVFDITADTQKKWDVSFVPAAVLINSKDEITYKGSPSWDKISEEIEKMLKLKKGTVKIESENIEHG